MTPAFRCDNPEASAIPSHAVEVALAGIEAELGILERRVAPRLGDPEMAFYAGQCDGGIRKWLSHLREIIASEPTAGPCQFDGDDPAGVDFDREAEVWTCPSCGKIHGK